VNKSLAGAGAMATFSRFGLRSKNVNHAIIIFGGVLALSGCGAAPGTTPLAQPLHDAAVKQAAYPNSGYGYEVIYAFPLSAASGGGPASRLLPVAGYLIGTTPGGADFGGVVYRVTPTGTQSVLYAFDGRYRSRLVPNIPYSGVVAIGSKLYGTTQYGGSSQCKYGCGVLYELSAGGNLRVVYEFKSSYGHTLPGDLTAIGGVLYGTTLGMAFAITPSGQERSLHRFYGQPDGGVPNGGLVALNGVLWGTTQNGGSANDGTVFAVDAGGRYRLVYSFKGGVDGAHPLAGLTVANGILYGTTRVGGTDGLGTVYSVTTSGVEQVVHSFVQTTADGHNPVAALIYVNGNLYGTTVAGGALAGTIFKVSPSGQEELVHSFLGGSDGSAPVAGLAEYNGMLYGTTQYCAKEYNCAGTVFRFSP
jgi:uncharacterized repeat protein (TIGR03803 family)